MPLIDYKLMREGDVSVQTASMYEYLIGSNGVFLAAEREGLNAFFKIAPCEIRGLAEIEPQPSPAEMWYPRVPLDAVRSIVGQSARAGDREGRPVEALFHLVWDKDAGQWQLHTPPQLRGATHVKPLETGPGSSYANALIEIHSHHEMSAFWSETDNRDEQGFRLYGVIGNLYKRATLRLRVGVYGYFCELDPAQFFELPQGIHCDPGFQGRAWEAPDQPDTLELIEEYEEAL